MLFVVAEPCLCQLKVGVLSVALCVVASRQSWNMAIMSCWMMVAVYSRSEFVTRPLGFLKVTRLLTTAGGNLTRQTTGFPLAGCKSGKGAGGGMMMPPMPVPEASVVP